MLQNKKKLVKKHPNQRWWLSVVVGKTRFSWNRFFHLILHVANYVESSVFRLIGFLIKLIPIDQDPDDFSQLSHVLILKGDAIQETTTSNLLIDSDGATPKFLEKDKEKSIG